MRRTLVALLASSFTLAGACGAPVGDDPPVNPGYEIPDGKNDSLTPTGTDRLGKLTVTSPPVTNGLYPINPTAYFVQPTIVYERPNGQRVVEGQRYVGLYLHNGPPYDGTTVTIRKDQTTTLQLAGLHLDNFYSYPTTVGRAPRWVSSRSSLLGDIAYAGIPGTFFQLIAEPFTLTLQADRVLARIDINPVAGKVTQLDAAIQDPRMVLVAKAPERGLPDAKSARFLKAMNVPARSLVSIYGSGEIIRSDSVKLVDGAQHTALGNDMTGDYYNLYLNGTWTEVRGKAGQIIDLPIRRLDVADVEVTDEDGNLTTVRGTYSVEWAHPASWGNLWIGAEEAQQLPTSSGVDLVPGKYRVTVTYPRHEAPTPGKTVYNIELK